MKSTDKESARHNTMLGAAKASHIMSKINAESISSSRIIPVIRTELIPSPQYFKTDPANFLALVQNFTGKKPGAKELTGIVGSKKKKTIVDEYYIPKQVREKEYPKSAVIERNSWDVEEGGVQMCDDFLNSLVDQKTWIS